MVLSDSWYFFQTFKENQEKQTNKQTNNKNFKKLIATTNGEKSQRKVDSEIQILPSDNSSHRTDSTMEKVESTNVDIKPAGELENSVRQPGGRDRESK